MERKVDRTMDKYMRAGAMMRLYKTLGSKLAIEISKVQSAQDQDMLRRSMERVSAVCSKAEDNMFSDHPDLSSEYINVFYGSTNGKPVNQVDKEVIGLAREIADELFD